MSAAVRRVLLLHEYEGGFGGAERYLEVLAGGLAAKGVSVAAVVFARDTSAAGGFIERLDRAGAKPTSLHRLRSRPIEIALAVRRFEPDVLHWNGVDPFAFRGGTMLLLPWGRPSVLTDHLPMLTDGLHWETTRRLVNRRVPAVIVVGHEGERAAREHWSSPPRLRVIENGVSADRARLRGREDASPLRLSLVGRLVPQKDPLFALDVVAELRRREADVAMVIAGAGPLREAVDERLDADPALAARVSCVGHVHDVTEVLLGTACYLAPARFEGLPFTPLEALASGAPAVLSDIPAHREIASNVPGAVTLAPVGDVAAWAHAVEAVAGDLEAASRAAIGGIGAYSIDAMIDRTLAVYRDVLDDVRRGTVRRRRPPWTAPPR